MKRKHQKDNMGYLRKRANLIIHNIIREKTRDEALDLFLKRCATLTKPRVLELGVKRSQPGRSTMHKEWIPTASIYHGTDISDGIDVDFVSDVHRLSSIVGKDKYDIIISCSTFEHFKYPHLAAHEIMKTLTTGGLLYIQTHQTFELHSYPFDYFRFSTEALSGLFGTKNGFTVNKTNYMFRARIFSREILKSFLREGYLNVSLFGEKLDETPEEYIYEWEI